MKKIILVLIIFILSAIFIKYSHAAETQKDQDIDYAQKYYEKIYQAEQEQLKKVKEFEPKTPFSKFVDKIVGSVAMVSLIVVIIGWICISAFGDDDGLLTTLLKGYTAITTYLVVNYGVWFLLRLIKNKYLDQITIASMAITGLLFFLFAFLTYKDKKDAKLALQIPEWQCPSCNVTNHYNDNCWNCKTPKKT